MGGAQTSFKISVGENDFELIDHLASTSQALGLQDCVNRPSLPMSGGLSAQGHKSTKNSQVCVSFKRVIKKRQDLIFLPVTMTSENSTN